MQAAASPHEQQTAGAEDGAPARLVVTTGAVTTFNKQLLEDRHVLAVAIWQLHMTVRATIQ